MQMQSKPKPVASKVERRSYAQSNTPIKKKSEKKPEKKNNKQNDLLRLAKESISKFNKPTKPVKLDSLKLIGDLNIDKTEIYDPKNEDTFGYQEEVVFLLRSYLRLPEHGTVKVSLTILRSGKVGKFKVVTSDSKQNRHYVETSVPQITFPGFSKNFIGQNDHTFLITLTSQT